LAHAPVRKASIGSRIPELRSWLAVPLRTLRTDTAMSRSAAHLSRTREGMRRSHGAQMSRALRAAVGELPDASAAFGFPAARPACDPAAPSATRSWTPRSIASLTTAGRRQARRRVRPSRVAISGFSRGNPCGFSRMTHGDAGVSVVEAIGSAGHSTGGVELLYVAERVRGRHAWSPRWVRGAGFDPRTGVGLCLARLPAGAIAHPSSLIGWGGLRSAKPHQGI
jgi:hypothetical protein